MGLSGWLVTNLSVFSQSCFPCYPWTGRRTHRPSHPYSPGGCCELTDIRGIDSRRKAKDNSTPLEGSPASFSKEQSLPLQPVPLPHLPCLPSLAETLGMEQPGGAAPSAEEVLASYHLPAVKPLWLNANYAKHIVKGNFLTLSAKPKTVEMGEWVAHQGESV